MTDVRIDEVKMLVVDFLGESFSLYTPEQIVELEEAFCTDDPKELAALYAKWEARGAIDLPEEPEVECEQCQRAVRFGCPPQCEEHPWVPPE